MTADTDDLQSALEGRADLVDALDLLDGASWERAARAVEPHILASAAVAQVLRDYLSRSLTDPQTSKWGTLARTGHLPAPGAGRYSMDIEYDPSKEDAVAQTVLRLEAIGDLIDGSIDAEEGEELLALLEAPGDERS